MRFTLAFLLIGLIPTFSPAQERKLEPYSYRDIVKKTLPAVVFIEAFGANGKSLSIGSGVIIDADGTILTNQHVINNAEIVEVVLNDGRKFSTRNLRGDAKTDLAIVRLSTGGKLPFLPLGDSDNMEVGDRVLAIGAPFGLAGSVTHGIVSAKARNIRINQYEDFIQTDAAINPGNSGGPLINLEGEVIGINSAIRTKNGSFQGVGLAISSNLARKIKDSLLKDGVVKRGWLGVQIKDIDPAIGARLGLPRGVGALISRVNERSPARDAGMIDGDIVLEVAGKEVHDSNELRNLIAGLPLNQTASLSIDRDGRKLTIRLLVQSQPDNLAPEKVAPPRVRYDSTAVTQVESFGVGLVPMNEELARMLGFKDDNARRGVLVISVKANTPAESAGITQGTVVSAVDRTPVATAADLDRLLKLADAKKGALLTIRSPIGGSDFLLVPALR